MSWRLSASWAMVLAVIAVGAVSPAIAMVIAIVFWFAILFMATTDDRGED